MAVDDVFPRRNLPGDPETGQSAEPWGRAVEDRVVGVEAGLEVVSQGLAGLNRSTASSLGSLADQISDLAGRVSYNTSSTAEQAYSGVSNPISSITAFGPTLSFSLDRPRVVSVTTGVQADIGGAALFSGESFTIGLYLWAYVDGVLSPSSSMSVVIAGASYAPGSSAKTDSAYQNITSRSLIPLAAGSHSIRCAIQGTVTLAGTATAFGYARNPIVFADVLQPV